MDLFSQQFGTEASNNDHRASIDSVDELVARNIQEVLQAANLDNAGASSSAASHAMGGPGSLTRPASAAKRPSSGRGSGAADAKTSGLGDGPSAFTAAAVTAVAAPPGASTSMLDVPGHAEATIRLHKARIKALEEEQARLVKALAERDQALADSGKEARALKAERAAWAKDKKALEAQVERLQRRATDAESALAARESAAKEVTKETSRLDKERRAMEADMRARDVRLQRALEEVAKYKAMLEELRSQERDTQDVVRSDVARLTAENKRLERQRGELLVAFKKQLKLVDVLKRQRVHLEAARALQFTESEFMQLLEVGGPAAPSGHAAP